MHVIMIGLSLSDSAFKRVLEDAGVHVHVHVGTVHRCSIHYVCPASAQGMSRGSRRLQHVRVTVLVESVKSVCLPIDLYLVQRT